MNVSNYSLPKIDDRYKTQDLDGRSETKYTEPGKIINLREEG